MGSILLRLFYRNCYTKGAKYWYLLEPVVERERVELTYRHCCGESTKSIGNVLTTFYARVVYLQDRLFICRIWHLPGRSHQVCALRLLCLGSILYAETIEVFVSGVSIEIDINNPLNLWEASVSGGANKTTLVYQVKPLWAWCEYVWNLFNLINQLQKGRLSFGIKT